MLPTSGRYLTPSVCHVPVAAAPENDQLPYASTAPTVHGIIANRFKPEAFGAFALSVWMRNKAACARDAAVVHHRASMQKLTKAEMSSNAQSTG
jgi:hypothetical protein